jgi:hypothetical protein
MFASSAVQRGCEPRSGQIKDNEIGIYCFSTKHAALRSKNKNGWLGIRVMCPSGETCLTVGCYCGELTLKKSNSTC